MDNHFNPSVSIEQFAAYLDGNLPENEMQRISLQIENDEALKSILDISEQVDSSMEKYSSSGLEIPEELVNLDFELPNMHDTLVPLDIASADLIPDVAACAEDFHFVGEHSNEHLYTDNSDISNQDYSGEDNSDDFSDLDNTQISLDE